MSGVRLSVWSLSLLFLCVLAVTDAASIPRHPRAATETCGYKTCHAVEPNKLNIHLVPHTHDDVGWLKTVDQYYFGSKSMIQKAGVQYILDSVIQSLLADPSRKFIYVETAFLWKWWLRQNDKVKEDVKMLINEGRLEIIGGAWSMNDEATTHYHSLIDQFTWGFRRLNDTFGTCARPHIGWQIDPFGHSREQASLFAQMGFDGMLFGRLDYQDKTKRLQDKAMEFIWRGSPSLGKKADLFTAAMFNTYSPPPGFCFDVLCADEPIIDDPDSPDYNVDERVESFLAYAVKQATYFRTNNIILTMGGDFTYQHAEMYYMNLDKMIRRRTWFKIKERRTTKAKGSIISVSKTVIPRQVELFLAYAQIVARSYKTNNIILTMGDDFHFQHAEMWFGNLDKLIRYMTEKKGSSVNIFYSTPSCYLKSLHDANLQWPTKTDDFFPYASDPHAFWTGYFSSRPTVKFFERMGNNLLQISKQLTVLTDLKNYDEHLEHFREAMGIMQHHDAVTGTEKQLVANDYDRILYESMVHGEKISVDALKKWALKEGGVGTDPAPNLFSCMQLNISSCNYVEDTKSFLVEIYNPLGYEMKTHIRLPVYGKAYSVVDFSDEQGVISQLVPIPEPVFRIPGRQSKATKELIFRATIPALGFKVYKVVEKEGEEPQELETGSSIHTDLFDISVNENNQVVVNFNKQKNMNFVQSFHYYEGAEGDNRVFENRSSGAYIFRPKTPLAKNFDYFGSYQVFKGPVVDELHQKVNEWVSQVVRVYKDDEHVEFNWLVGPIPVEDKIGKEIVTKYTSNLNSHEEFYTDSNGREMLKRKRNFRPTWDLQLKEPVAGNYYPVTSKISVKDEERSLKLSALTDRAQGGTSMKDGELELMLHRRLLRDDAFGVGEALNESAFGEGLVVRGTHYLYGGSLKNLDVFALKEKNLALELALRPLTLVSSVTEQDLNKWKNAYKQTRSGLAKPLPPNVHILTLEPWKDGTILLRLEHLFEVGESLQHSQPVEVNIKDLFSTFDILQIEETTLGGNQWLKDMDRLKWQSETNDVLQEQQENVPSVQVEGDVINVLLKPMEIRTFILNVSPRKL